jgi:FAD/FMN-containing dehydrogenase
MKVAMANGEILKVSPTENSEIFRAVIGGYGQFAVIIEVELETCPNNMLEFDSVFMSTSDFSAYFSKLIEQDPAVELAYGRLSVDTSNFLEEAGLFWYRKAEGVSTDEIIPENLVAFKRTIFRSSEFSDYGKKSRWMIEKRYSALNNHKSFSRNSVMSSDIHVLWPMRKGHIDILQEYFIPKSSMNIFVERLKKTILKHKMNLLNATIREVKQDDISLLSYARTDVFGFVLLFSEKTGDPGEIKMQNFTRELINEVTDLGGTFYLPYRLHYTYRQLMTSYPMIEDWLAVKNRLDHKNVFSSNFLEYITNLIEVKE